MSSSGGQVGDQVSPGVEGGIFLNRIRPGSGVPLVLLHAFPVDSRMWHGVVEHLPDGVDVWLVDLPGMGRSPEGEAVARDLGFDGDSPSLEVSAAAVSTVLRGAGVDSAVFVGLSMGGYVGLTLLETEPAMVAGLGLFDTKTSADPDGARANRLRIAQAVTDAGTLDEVLGMADNLIGQAAGSGREEVVSAVRSLILDQTPAGVAWCQRAMAARPDRSGFLAGFEGPVAVLVGEHDELSPVEPSRQMSDSAKDSAFTVVPNAGHLTALEDPRAVAAAVAELMSRVR